MVYCLLVLSVVVELGTDADVDGVEVTPAVNPDAAGVDPVGRQDLLKGLGDVGASKGFGVDDFLPYFLVNSPRDRGWVTPDPTAQLFAPSRECCPEAHPASLSAHRAANILLIEGKAMFDRILVPMDRSALAECVLPHAVTMARAFRSKLILVHAMETSHGANWRRAVDPLNWRIRKAEAESYLDSLARRLQARDVPVEKQILEGPAAEQIVEFAQTRDVALIVLSSHGQSGLTGWNISSIAQKIVLRARTSILLVRAYQAAAPEMTDIHYHRLLVPLDGSQRAEFILPVAATLARNQDSEILLTHVARRPELPRQMPLTSDDLELADRLVERNQAEATQYLQDLRSHLPVMGEARVMLGEDIPTPLHELVDQERIDLVLLSAHGHSGRGKWPYGGVVMNFMAFGTTPLLVIQDLPRDQIASTQAELAAMEHGRP
jgi:nucleotide-binding universal stress UspA family protein